MGYSQNKVIGIKKEWRILVQIFTLSLKLIIYPNKRLKNIRQRHQISTATSN